MVTVGVLLEIYRNTVLNWRAIDVTYGGLKAILYATTMNIHAELASFAVAHGWTVLEAPRLSAAGVHTCAHLYTPVHTWLDGAGGTAAECCRCAYLYTPVHTCAHLAGRCWRHRG